MLTIFHGEQIIKSRLALVAAMAEARQQDVRIERVAAKELTGAALEQLLGNQSLYGEDRLVIIDELHSLPKSKKKDGLIDLVANSQVAVILWEKRTLTKTMLKKFSGAKEYFFKASHQLFPWLDSLGAKDQTNQLKTLQILKQEEGSGFVFAMLARQIRLLIATKDDGRVKGAPFVVSKLRQQARRFELNQLLMAHHRLLEIDYQQKTSSRPFNLDQELDLWLLSL